MGAESMIAMPSRHEHRMHTGTAGKKKEKKKEETLTTYKGKSNLYCMGWVARKDNTTKTEVHTEKVETRELEYLC
jgi:hypothetical protein